MLWHWITENAELLVNLAAVAGSIGTVGSALWWLWARKAGPFLKRLLGTWDSIDMIKAEISLNGGISLKDVAMRTDRAVGALSLQVSLMQGVQRAMLSQASKGYFETDAAGRYIWVNRYFLDLTGQQLADALVNGWQASVAPADRRNVVEEWHACIKQDRDFDMNFGILNSDGDVLPVRGTARRVKDSAGATIAWAGSIMLAPGHAPRPPGGAGVAQPVA